MIKILKAKKEIIYIIALLLVVALNDQFLVPLPSVNIFYNYNISQWGLTYDTGFIFRGFLGATLNYFHLIFTDFFIYYSLLAFLVILLIGLFTLIKLYKIQPGIHMFVFVFLIISLPSNIRWWKSYSMFASMDMFIFINSVVIIFLILKLKNEIISTTAGVVISIISILINEYFIFIYLPIILSLMIYKSFKEKGKVGVVKIILFTFPVMIVCIFVFLNGTTEIAPEVLNKMIRENVISTYQVPICYNLAYENLYYKNVIEKIQSSFINIRLKDIIKILITVILLMPSIAIYFKLLFKGYLNIKNSVNKKIFIILCVSSICPLIGMLFVDFYYMWLGYVMLNATVLILVLFFIDSDFRESGIEYIKKRYIMIGLVSVYNVCLGIFGTASSYSFLEEIFKQIS